MTTLTDDPKNRQTWMGLLARATPARLMDLLPDLPPHDVLRGPEVGGRDGAGPEWVARDSPSTWAR